MATDLSTISGALKRVYDKRAEMTQNLEARAIDELSKAIEKYSPEGDGYFGAINDYGNEAVGAITETESFRSADNENYVQWKVQPKVLTAPVQFSGLSVAATGSDEGAFVRAAIDAMDKAKTRLLKDENRQFYGLGNGLLASPAGTVASNATSFSVDSAQYLRANMVIDIFNGSTKTVDSKRIQSVDKVNNVVYFATSLGAALATSDALVKENIRDSAPTDGKEMLGLRGIVDDGTDLTTVQNIDASSNREWRARRIDASSANITQDLMQRLIDDVATLSGEEPDKLIMHRKQRRKWLDIVMPQRRYADGKMDAGFTKIEFNGKELWLDVDCQDNVIYAVNLKYLHLFELEKMGLGKHEDSGAFLRTSGKDVYEAFWRHYCNIGTRKRNAHGKIVNLAKPTGVS